MSKETIDILIWFEETEPPDFNGLTLLWNIFAKDLNDVILGGFVNFAIHGIALDSDNLLFSSDIPGGIERELESHFMTKTKK